MPENSNLKDGAEIAKGIIEAVPIYHDVVQPAAREIGKALQTVAKVIHVALAPVSALVWSYDKVAEYLESSLAEKMKTVPAEDIITPLPNLAVPAIESLRYVAHSEELKEMFSNLICAAMDRKTSKFALPSFTDVIKQMTPDEARLIKRIAAEEHRPVVTIKAEKSAGVSEKVIYRHYSMLGEHAGCDYPENIALYLDSLVRLGLIEIPRSKSYTDKSVYEEVKKAQAVVEGIEWIKLNMPGFLAVVEEEIILITNFGEAFIGACVLLHSEARQLKP